MYPSGPFRRSLALAMTVIASAFLAAGVLPAAEMERVPAGKVDFIFIKGAITEGDGHKFGQLATETDQHKLQMMKLIGDVAIAPESIARGVAYAIEQPDDVDVGSIVIRPTAQG
ncbi:hypothetical protein [Mesorhizobium sp. M2E.F.Ca.ET.219.01.1.1]|uniref:hypothetical protein n=1 Tax=Mesorhizobium sp. M2E.F.Ca.ET.219.01.1.1 TaxID=2500530 RepID=UPI001AED284B|nr:hypothetical protein [Mesorhizobium sp. M2E.F.Ca.ET.219.01.1.1]